MAEEENQTLKNEKSEVFLEKNELEEELKQVQADLGMVFNRIKLGNQSRQSRSNTSLSNEKVKIN